MPKKVRKDDNGDEITYKRKFDWFGRILIPVVLTLFAGGSFLGYTLTKEDNVMLDFHPDITESVNENRFNLKSLGKDFDNHEKAFLQYKEYSKELINTKLENIVNEQAAQRKMLEALVSRLPN